MLTKLMHLYNLFKKLSTFRKLHYNMHISIVNVGLMELDDIRMVYLGKNP